MATITIFPDWVENFTPGGNWSFDNNPPWDFAQHIQNKDLVKAHFTGDATPNQGLFWAHFDNPPSSPEPDRNSTHLLNMSVTKQAGGWSVEPYWEVAIVEGYGTTNNYIAEFFGLGFGTNINLYFDGTAIIDYNNIEIVVTVYTDAADAGKRISFDYAAISFDQLPDDPITQDPPTGVTASRDLTTGIYVSWNKPSGAGEYLIYRNQSGVFDDGDYVWTNPSGNDTDWLDDSVNPNEDYYYWVKARSGTGVESEPAASNPGLMLPQAGLVVAPAAITAGTSAEGFVLELTSIELIPNAASARTRAKAPFELGDSEVDGFFQWMGQQYSYTNYSYRKRDTYMAVDSANDLMYWMYPTASEEPFVKQLPRVIMSIHRPTGKVGLSNPIPWVAVVPPKEYAAFRNKTGFAIHTVPSIPFTDRYNTVLIVIPLEYSTEDLLSDTEEGLKGHAMLDGLIYTGPASKYASAEIVTKFFRPPTDTPNIMTRITGVRPVFSHGDAANLSFGAKLWTSSTWRRNDNVFAANPSTESRLILDGNIIIFEDSKYGLEHCVGLDFDTNNGSDQWQNGYPYYSGGGIVGIEVFYTEQESGWR